MNNIPAVLGMALLGIACLPWQSTGSIAVAQDPQPYEVFFYQQNGFQGKSDSVRLAKNETYAILDTDDDLATRHFIRSVKVGSNVGVLFAYDNTASTARPRTLVCSSHRSELGDLAWFALSAIVFNRDVVEHPEGVLFSNRSSRQSTGERRELFVLVNQKAPPSEVYSRHGLRYAHLFGPAEYNIPSLEFAAGARETELRVRFSDKNGKPRSDRWGQIYQGVWTTNYVKDLNYNDVGISQIQDVQVRGSERLYRGIGTKSSGQPVNPKQSTSQSGLSQLDQSAVAPGAGSLQPNLDQDFEATLPASETKWSSVLGKLTLSRFGTLISGQMQPNSGEVMIVHGIIGPEGMDLNVWGRTGMPQGWLKLKFDATGKNANGTWFDLASGQPVDVIYQRN